MNRLRLYAERLMNQVDPNNFMRQYMQEPVQPTLLERCIPEKNEVIPVLCYNVYDFNLLVMKVSYEAKKDLRGQFKMVHSVEDLRARRGKIIITYDWSGNKPAHITNQIYDYLKTRTNLKRIEIDNDIVDL
jgi:hypothetical protein